MKTGEINQVLNTFNTIKVVVRIQVRTYFYLIK